MNIKKFAAVDIKRCTACGECAYSCRKNAVEIRNGCFAYVDEEKCIGCGLCSRNCPSGCIEITERAVNDHA
ncbi:MAG: 4Fe-4S binding protein [Bacillota bacterium]|nr:4Fe-4S binding protein [Bacillota bacterium]